MTDIFINHKARKIPGEQVESLSFLIVGTVLIFPSLLINNWIDKMRIAELFIRVKKDKEGNTFEEPWVVITKKNGKVIKKLRYKHYEKTKHSLPLKNRILLRHLSSTNQS